MPQGGSIMTVEMVAKMLVKEAKEQIEVIENLNGDRPLTWGQTDALGDVRSSLRECLGVLSNYIDDLSLKEVLHELYRECGPNNMIIEGLLYELF